MILLRFFGRILMGVFRGIGRFCLWLFLGLVNLRRWFLRGGRPDYVVFELSGELLERTPVQPRLYQLLPFFPTPLTIESLANSLQQIARDPDVRGVLFLVKGLEISLAQAQSLADLFSRFRTWDEQARKPGKPAKEVVVFLEQCSNAVYVMAAAADRVAMPPSAEWNVLGLRAEPVFLADTLTLVGLEADVVRVAPWKTAYDMFSRSEISEANREQLNRLLDGWFEDLVQAISVGRVLGENQVRSLIDAAPLPAGEAKARKLIDHVCFEDELPAWLTSGEREARLLPYREARRHLKRRLRPRSKGAVGVISLTGIIVTGKSRHFPGGLPIFGEGVVGSSTVQQLVRAALEDDRLAAVVVHVDSSGGSALASDLMWRELNLLARKKPVVVYMGDVAASGGYYISLPAHQIVCQRATLTGSIGVITAKLVTAEAHRKLAAHRYTLQRGKNADLYTDSRPWLGEQREKIEEQIEHAYRLFKERVSAGRKLSAQALEDVAGGRVWTGAQAQQNGLVDHLGDFLLAVENACALAGLPTDGSTAVVPVLAERERMPLTARALGLEPGAPVEELLRAGFALLQGDWSRLLGADRVWLLADGLPRRR